MEIPIYCQYLSWMSSPPLPLLLQVILNRCNGPLTIRRTLLPSFLVNFSTFAFLFNFSFLKQTNHQSFRYRGRICIININNRDLYVHQGISLIEYIGNSFFSYTMLPRLPSSLWYIIHYHVLHLPCNGCCVSLGEQHLIRKKGLGAHAECKYLAIRYKFILRERKQEALRPNIANRAAVPLLNANKVDKVLI